MVNLSLRRHLSYIEGVAGYHILKVSIFSVMGNLQDSKVPCKTSAAQRSMGWGKRDLVSWSRTELKRGSVVRGSDTLYVNHKIVQARIEAVAWLVLLSRQGLEQCQSWRHMKSYAGLGIAGCRELGGRDVNLD